MSTRNATFPLPDGRAHVTVDTALQADEFQVCYDAKHQTVSIDMGMFWLRITLEQWRAMTIAVDSLAASAAII